MKTQKTKKHGRNHAEEVQQARRDYLETLGGYFPRKVKTQKNNKLL